MRILFKKEEEKLDKLLESQHNQLNLYKGKVEKLEKKKEELTIQNEDLQVKLVSATGAKGGYIKKINELKAELEEANKTLDTNKELISYIEKQKNDYATRFEETNKKLIEANRKLDEANKKIENYKKDALSNRIKPTIQEYDQKLKYRRNKNKTAA